MTENAEIAEAAREYVAARRFNDAASVDAWSVALSRVDAAWCRLLELVEEDS